MLLELRRRMHSPRMVSPCGFWFRLRGDQGCLPWRAWSAHCSILLGPLCIGVPHWPLPMRRGNEATWKRTSYRATLLRSNGTLHPKEYATKPADSKGVEAGPARTGRFGLQDGPAGHLRPLANRPTPPTASQFQRRAIAKEIVHSRRANDGSS